MPISTSTADLRALGRRGYRRWSAFPRPWGRLSAVRFRAARRQRAGPTLWPVAAAFVGFGMFWGSWSVAVADIEHELGLSHGAFGLLLSVGLAAGGVANALGGALAERHGTSRVLA